MRMVSTGVGLLNAHNSQVKPAAIKPIEIKTQVIEEKFVLSTAERDYYDWLQSVGHKIDDKQAKGLFDLKNAAGIVNSFSTSGNSLTIIIINQ